MWRGDVFLRFQFADYSLSLFGIGRGRRSRCFFGRLGFCWRGRRSVRFGLRSSRSCFCGGSCLRWSRRRSAGLTGVDGGATGRGRAWIAICAPGTGWNGTTGSTATGSGPIAVAICPAALTCFRRLSGDQSDQHGRCDGSGGTKNLTYHGIFLVVQRHSSTCASRQVRWCPSAIEFLTLITTE